MNVFTTLKTVFFGNKLLSRSVPTDGTPRRDLAIALNGLLPLCRNIPGMHLAVDIREGRAALVLDWTPRTDEKALAEAYHYIVSNEGGVMEVAEPQFLLTESRKNNPLESRNVTPQRPATPSKAADKKQAKSRTLMQEVAAFLTSHYRFRFNVLTEETEVAAMESRLLPK